MESKSLISRENAEKKEVKSIAKYEKIKADYFLQKVFDNLKKKRTLEIVKNNKNIKKRINICINDYKEYSEKYSSIEVEIKPVNNKLKERIDININDYIKYSQKYSSIEIELKVKSIRNESDKYDKFFNIKDEYLKYYHIHFNNNKEEIKRNYINKNEK